MLSPVTVQNWGFVGEATMRRLFGEDMPREGGPYMLDWERLWFIACDVDVMVTQRIDHDACPEGHRTKLCNVINRCKAVSTTYLRVDAQGKGFKQR